MLEHGTWNMEQTEACKQKWIATAKGGAAVVTGRRARQSNRPPAAFGTHDLGRQSRILKGILLIRKRPMSRISGCILPQLTNPVLG